MKTRASFFLLVTTVLLFFGCERAEKSGSASISVRMPSTEAIQTMASSKLEGTSPTNLAEINCFAVFVTGPEEDLRRNSCLQDGVETSRFVVGPSRVGIPAGEEISINVPSGLDRVVSVVGFRSAAGNCFDWKAVRAFPEEFVSPGFILGSAGGLNLDPGSTKEVPILLGFNSSKWFNRCQGPDFNDSGDSGTPPINLAIKKVQWPEYYMIGSSMNPCVEFEVSLNDTLGSLTSLPVGKSLNIGVTAIGSYAPPSTISSPFNLFETITACINDTVPVTKILFDSSTNRKRIFVRGGSTLMAMSQFKIEAAPSSPSEIATISATWQNEIKLDSLFSYQFTIVPSAVRVGCYKATIENKKFSDLSLISDSVSLVSSSNLSIYSNANCTGALTGYTGVSKTFYFQIDATAISTQKIAVSGAGVAYSQVIELAPGTPTPSALKIIGYDSVPRSASCGPDSQLRVMVVNALGSPVPSPGSALYYNLTYPSSYMDFKDGSCAGVSIASGATRLFPAGVSEDSIYYQPGSLPYVGSIVFAPSLSIPSNTFKFEIK